MTHAMTCAARDCTTAATPTPVNVNGTPRHLCDLHTLAAHIWRRTTAPDLDQRPHVQRGCAIPNCHRDRAIGRAVCDHHARIGDEL